MSYRLSGLKPRCGLELEEPLQQLYLDVSRLVALAYPSSESALVNHLAKEAFVMALDGARLQLSS